MRRAALRFLFFSIPGCTLAAVGCSGADAGVIAGDNRRAQPGAEGGDCITTGTACDVGLVCLSSVCVKPADGTHGSGHPTGDATSPGTDNTSGDASSSVDAAPEASPPECKFKHPLLDAGARFCGPGDCYCSDPDSCYPKSEAQLCCKAQVVCY